MARRRGKSEGSIGRRTEDGLWYAWLDLGRDASRQSLEVYSRLALSDAQREYDRVIGHFPV